MVRDVTEDDAGNFQCVGVSSSGPVQKYMTSLVLAREFYLIYRNAPPLIWALWRIQSKEKSNNYVGDISLNIYVNAIDSTN